VTPAGKRRIVRVLVDTDGGIDLDTVAAVSKAVSAILDETEVMAGGPYVLEVTSPGVGRPLTLPRHWRRNLDRLVTVDLRDGRRVQGRIVAATDTAATVSCDGGDPREVAFADVATARIEVEFRRQEG
jgi:ribosome maturation factor RimP